MRGSRGLWLPPIIILLVAAAPVISMVLSTWIAGGLGCKLDEGDTHPCLLAGIDIGDLLYDMFVMGWFGSLTIPLGALGLVAWAIWAIITVRESRRQRTSV
jgi:hypothetical protein